MSEKITYKDAGVNVDLGNEASKIFYKASKLSWNNRVGKFGEVKSSQNSFSGLRFLDLGDTPKGTKVSLSSDGIGTKVEIAERMKNHSTIAFDLIAMVADDAVVRGGVPISLATVLDVNSLSKDKNVFKYLQQLGEGYTKAADSAGISISNGELAELPDRICGYGDFNYNWGSTLLWASTSDKLIDGSKVEVGSSVVFLQEKGFRSNGFSLLRKIMKSNFGDEWHNKEVDGIKLGEEALIPSTIYCKCVVDMIGDLGEDAKCNVQAVSHITGGGVPEKLGRVLEEVNLGLELDNLYTPNALMLKCQELASIPDEEIYKTWCMGQGMAIITNEPEKVIAIAKEHNIDAKVGGKIVSGQKIRIKSQGFFKKDEWLEF
ncbi:MAG: hypothetical protein HRU03_00545 [Nanoarchaeales archaeon]|nr:hypothetical protein [Nanoarchaeales archaeon]